MTRKKKLVLLSSAALAIAAAAAMYGPITRMLAFKTPRYETGIAFKGADSCKRCHRAIYDEWRASGSARATQDPYMHLVLARQPYFPNRMMLGEPCYACHGPKALDEGISCEVCHGINDRDDVMEVHRRKYALNLDQIRRPEACAACHEAIHPLTNEPIITTFAEWKSSQAARQGIGCVDCHMKRDATGHVYHGGGSRRVDPSVYRDVVEVKNLKYGRAGFTVEIENKITGHYLPTGGPEPALLMELALNDKDGRTLHTFEAAFQRKSRPVMAFPGHTVSDNRLRDGETRTLEFQVPAGLVDEPASVLVTLRFLDIDFVDVGDIKKARGPSPKFYEKRFALPGSTEPGASEPATDTTTAALLRSRGP